MALLEKGIETLRGRIFSSPDTLFFPSRLELFLRLEHEIREVLHSSEPLWQPLIGYINKSERRKIALVHHLAQLFERYGIYAGGAALDWEKHPNGWQEALWATIFKEWEYPQRALQGIKEPQRRVPHDISVHLFAFSHISPLYYRFLCRTAQHVPVYFYQLSPCQEFWSDLSPDHPSLLSSFGRVGREMARLVEQSELPIEESYLVFGGNTQLRRLQRNLLNLQPTEEVVDDTSIQVHLSTTPHQEIIHLHQLLLSLCNTGIEPKDILVMAPQIALYAPYIQALFGKTLHYQIADMPLQKSNPAFEGLFLLLDLERQRWSAPAVLELFAHPLFCKKQGFAEDDLLQIKTWAHSTGIRWALDGAHRATLLKKGHCQKTLDDSSATWMEGLGHLIEELALPAYDPTQPHRIDLTQAETLGNLIEVLNSLHKDLTELESFKKIGEWVEYLRTLTEKYFVSTEESPTLFALLEQIGKAGRHFPETTYPFLLIDSLLKEYAHSESTTVHRNQLQAVRFCSMLPMRAIPAKVICLIGMNHDAFPRKERFQNLDLLKENTKSDYLPTRLDFDRYLFLEALVSAREKFIISYCGRDPYDLTELPPSSVVAELLPLISKNQIVVHAAHGTITPPPPFNIRTIEPLTLPKGEFVIDVADLTRLTRSSLSHYLHHHNLKMYQEEPLEAEESFLLSPSKKALLRKKTLQTSPGVVFKKMKREGTLPLGMFGKLAQMQLDEEMRALPEKPLTRLTLAPLQISLNSSLNVILTGTIDGVFSEGLCVPYKCDFKGALKAWPLFLLSSTEQLLFSPSQESKNRFFDDATPYLISYLEYFFYAKEHPLFLIPEWIEPILKKDPKKCALAPIYDPLLQWQLRGKAPPSFDDLIRTYHPLVEKIYKEMAHAWF